ncbi:MAG: class I SAM-dependent methyltransferase [Flavobacterium sp.]|uniref:class I SAM-dependent methyltransferase n=1 Tax=Flavobacterium sp. TaxID=239 RepID=UPI00260F52C5|nr:class I SAM-dependent methyltransferase [Flavobacterium sp.]MDD5152053.1 class I SAM-dependent methyltransferase [Flavobacterium sp.]
MKFSKFFSNVQETPWYRDFLKPVINEITDNSTLLDIGTGTGKLIQILSSEKNIDCVGVDTSSKMLLEAQKKLKKTNTKLIEIKTDKNLPFESNTLNYITICSVLFHLEKDSIDIILKESRRLLKNQGKIIVLTPTGSGNILTLLKNYFSPKNLSIYIWFYATRNRAGPWTKNLYLEQYALTNSLKYKRKIVMNGFAQVEVLEK